MTPLEPIPRDRALVPWQTSEPFEAQNMFDPRPPSPEIIAFLERILREFATALGLPLEEVESEVAHRGGPA